MNNHSTVQKLLTAYALGELNQQDTLQVESHLAECDACRDQLTQMQSVLNIADSMKADTAPEQAHNLAEQEIQAISRRTKTEESKKISWSKIMKSNITKSAAAAIILIGAFIFLTQGNGTSVAWADVIKQIKDFHPYKCKETIYYEGQEPFSMIDMHLSLSQRREERQNGQIFIFDMRECPIRSLVIDPQKKLAGLTISYEMGPAQDPDILQMLANMKESDAERLDARKINGIQTQGFRTVDEHNDITIWANVKTGLPVKLEITHLNRGRRIVLENFEFDVAFDESLFSTEPPQGYELHEVIRGQEVPTESGKQTGQEILDDIKIPAGPEKFIPHSYTEMVYYKDKQVSHVRRYHKTLSLSCEEKDDGRINIVDMTERPTRILTILPEARRAHLQLRYDIGPQKNLDFLAMLSGMRQYGAEKLGVKEIGGVESEGFRRVDPFNDITIWVDIKTGFPVKIEVVHPKSEQKIVCTDFDFETPLDDSLFSTVPPEGYDLKEEIVGFKADVKEVTKEQVYQTATRPTYVIANELSWTKKPFIIEASHPTVKAEKIYLSGAVGADGRHVVMGQSVIFDVNIKSKIRSGQGNKCLELNGFTVWNGGPEKWYSKIMLESAEGMIPPGISEDRTGYAIETPADTIIIVGINGALTDAELKELVEALELVTPQTQ